MKRGEGISGRSDEVEAEATAAESRLCFFDGVRLGVGYASVAVVSFDACQI